MIPETRLLLINIGLVQENLGQSHLPIVSKAEVELPVKELKGQ